MCSLAAGLGCVLMLQGSGVFAGCRARLCSDAAGLGCVRWLQGLSVLITHEMLVYGCYFCLEVGARLFSQLVRSSGVS